MSLLLSKFGGLYLVEVFLREQLEKGIIDCEHWQETFWNLVFET